MNGENGRLVIDEPVEFEKQPVQIQDFRKISDPFRGNLWNILQFNKEKWNMSTLNRENWLGLKNEWLKFKTSGKLLTILEEYVLGYRFIGKVIGEEMFCTDDRFL